MLSTVDGDDDLARALTALIRAASDPRRKRRLIDSIARVLADGEDAPTKALPGFDEVDTRARTNLERRNQRTRSK